MNPADAWPTDVDATVCEICGRESCEDHVAPDAPKSKTKTASARLTFIPANVLVEQPSPAEIVEGVALADCVSALVSESGVGKTFLLLDLAATIGSGVSWHGRDVQQGSVAYLAYEGDALSLRLRALREKTGHRLDHLYVVRAYDPLSPRITRDGEERSIGELMVLEAVKTLSADLHASQRPPIRLMVIDTVRASLAGSEDNSEHVAAYLRAVRRILAQLPGAAIVLAHHAGWQDGDQQRKRERGSSAWRGNVDATLYLEAGAYDKERREASITLTTYKLRDAQRPAPLHLIRRDVDLNLMDKRGQPVTSCVIERDRRSREDRQTEAAERIEQQQHEIDLQILRVMVQHPDDVTSQARIGQLLGGTRKLDIGKSIARLLNRALVRLPKSQRKPYTVTEAGMAALAE